MKNLITILTLTAFISSCSYFKKEPKEVFIIEDDRFVNIENNYIIEAEFAPNTIYDDTITPEVYSVVATRAVNKMLDETRSVYENLSSTFLYVTASKKMSDNLPDGFYFAEKTIKEIINGSRTYTIVSNIKDADYYLETLVSKIELPGQTPAIQYKLIMFDKDDTKIGEWVETIHKVTNDDRNWL